MARMWPRRLPREIVNHPYRKAEVTVYRQLERVLDDDYVVFYSRPWHGLTARGEEIDGECDFVVCHASLGMLAIEVKGGGIDYDPVTEIWTTTNRDGIRSRIKNPVEQARRSKHRILEKLRATRLVRADHYIRARHGVILPDCEEPTKRLLGADRPRGLFCTELRFERDLRGWIEERLSGPALPDEEGRPQEPLGIQGIRALEQILASPIHLKIPLRRKLREDEEEITVLTRDQCEVLKGLVDRQRAGICGPAGTGKTVLALEEAVRFARMNLRTGLICFNQGLAEELRARSAHEGNLTVATFHEHCGRVAAQAGVLVRGEGRTLYEEGLPEALMDSIASMPGLAFEALIVDEGQDFLPLWWTALEAALTGPRWLRVFFDRNQLIYAGRDLPADVPRVYDLWKVLRNTQSIFRACRHLYPAGTGSVLEAIGPEGEPVQYVEIQPGTDVQALLVETVRGFIEVERLAPGQIAVLLSHERSCRELAASLKFKSSQCTEKSEDTLVVDTVRRFKGLERPLVIVHLDEDVTSTSELTYVALTRGRSLLVVVGTPAHLAVAMRY